MFFILFSVILPMLISAQITKSDEYFEAVNVFDNKVVFVKEIQPKENNLNKNYFTLKEWAKINFAKDPFNSSVNYDDKNKKITARSRIELLLPENSKGVREKFIMKFRIDAFFSNDLCIVEITDINYINNSKGNGNTLEQKISAEKMISDIAISVQDANKETRANVRKNTIYFLNDLVNSLQNVFNN